MSGADGRTSDSTSESRSWEQKEDEVFNSFISFQERSLVRAPGAEGRPSLSPESFRFFVFAPKVHFSMFTLQSQDQNQSKRT